VAVVKSSNAVVCIKLADIGFSSACRSVKSELECLNTLIHKRILITLYFFDQLIALAFIEFET
jgi:hypothetical protein